MQQTDSDSSYPTPTLINRYADIPCPAIRLLSPPLPIADSRQIAWRTVSAKCLAILPADRTSARLHPG